MSKYNFVFGGKNSEDIFLYSFPDNSYWEPAEKNVDSVDVPGRNGSLIIDQHSYKNKSVSVKCILDGYIEKYYAVAEWLHGASGYRRFEPGWDPNVFILGRFSSMSVSEIVKDTAVISVEFDCKPQKFLKTGETETTLTASGKITNPTSFDSRPLVRVYGTGALNVGSQTITINKNTDYIDLDCDIEDAFTGTVNQNGNITMTSGEFFSLAPGENGITLGKGITKVVITPRWWRL